MRFQIWSTRIRACLIVETLVIAAHALALALIGSWNLRKTIPSP
jgi:hypothetical protein